MSPSGGVDTWINLQSHCRRLCSLGDWCSQTAYRLMALCGKINVSHQWHCTICNHRYWTPNPSCVRPHSEKNIHYHAANQLYYSSELTGPHKEIHCQNKVFFYLTLAVAHLFNMIWRQIVVKLWRRRSHVQIRLKWKIRDKHAPSHCLLGLSDSVFDTDTTTNWLSGPSPIMYSNFPVSFLTFLYILKHV